MLNNSEKKGKGKISGMKMAAVRPWISLESAQEKFIGSSFKFSLSALQSHCNRDNLISQYFCVRAGCLFQPWMEWRMHE